jgi:hypothetical protein
VADSPGPPARRPDPAPLPTRDRLTVAVGTGIWAVLLVACLADESALRHAHHLWWLAATAIGTGLGVVGVVFLTHRGRRRDPDRTGGAEPG